ncbi:hypothetical protein DICPUDRAFT_54139 [Dictyostelium purpureum]|uniref:Acetyl-coenzyme A transporter 1 n=1 Tax=Dictyostelium purpureum TaxID=5786 RepID=F0ZFR4_DICPU|nr:uncharacterized protein DICPUDRAFT_54139 [Dictyostelium purpureum]EGC37219.1 hypothetical protein DICPUDRAFT_54139 [Dictyostelium purpureum]|eukprot:XP_003286270.1 hypothetical protein DICPUDRAFT_54139 [Dictyostelium purpureum]
MFSLRKHFGDELNNIIWLVLLYLVQGIPIGLSFGTIPFLLHKHASYTQLGIFSISTYPYSLKLLWSPIVDSYFFKSFGRRKSWIVPIQVLTGLMFVSMSFFITDYIEHVETNIIPISLLFFTLIFLMATQDIAVDAWALSILSKPYLHYASTCQTIGLNTGFFLSYTIFLSLSSPHFANKYFRTTPSDQGLITLEGYLKTCGIFFIIFSLYLAFFKGEEPIKKRTDFIVEDEYNNNKKKSIVQETYGSDISEADLTPKQVYRLLWKIINLPHIKTLSIMFIVAKIVFQPNDCALSLKLLEKGLSKEDIASFSLIQFPSVILFSIFSSKWVKNNPLTIWSNSYLVGTFFVLINLLSVIFFPNFNGNEISWNYFFLLLVIHLLSTFSYNLLSVAQGSFFLKISDKSIGGTYVTLLNTIANFAGTYPKVFILMLIDRLTVSQCTVILPESSEESYISGTEQATIIIHNNISKDSCLEQKGIYTIERDGYYMVTMVAFVYGIFMFFVLKKYLVPIERLKL